MTIFGLITELASVAQAHGGECPVWVEEEYGCWDEVDSARVINEEGQDVVCLISKRQKGPPNSSELVKRLQKTIPRKCPNCGGRGAYLAAGDDGDECISCDGTGKVV